MWPIARACCVRVAALIVCCGACAPTQAVRDLDELVVRDSTYLDPSTLVPYSGPVVRTFPDDPERLEIDGALLGGVWHGELVVYHPSGRVRYAGAFAFGERCGPWTENSFDREPVNLYDELVSDIDAMGIYPPCPEGL